MSRKLLVCLCFLLVLFVSAGVALAAPQLWDDFNTGTTLDTTKWTLTDTDAGVITINNQKARVTITGNNTSGQRQRLMRRLRPATPCRMPYIQATVNISSSSTWSHLTGNTSIFAQAGIYGGLYNDTSFNIPNSTDGMTGNIEFYFVIFINNDNTMGVAAQVVRLENAVGSQEQVLWTQLFSTPIALDTSYQLSVEYKRTGLVFTCNAESHEFTIDTAFYYPFDGLWTYLDSRIFLVDGQSATMIYDWDNAYVYGVNNAGSYAGTYPIKSVNSGDNSIHYDNLTVNPNGIVTNDGQTIGMSTETGMMGGSYVDGTENVWWTGLVNSKGTLEGYWRNSDDLGNILSSGYFTQLFTDDDEGGGCFMSTVK